MASETQQEPIATSSPETKEHLEYPASADAYILLSEIGRGAFATVYRAKLKIQDEEVAVKILDLEELNTNWDEIRKEIQIMRSMYHPNVVPVYTAFVEEEELWIVMPLLAAGSCANIMKQLYPHGIKDEGVIAYILFEVLKGLQYFHKNDKIHRDVKAGNILLSRQGEVQLADFGVAGTLMENGDRKKNRSTFVGTPCWMAPEVMEQSRGYNSKADIWSFGITAMELGYGRAPYATYPPMKVLLMTMQEDPPTCEIYKDTSYRFSRHFQDMISKCLRKDISRRYSAEKLMKHKFFDHVTPVAHVIEKLITPLPPLEGDPNYPVLRKKRSAADHAARKPISVESWIFDDPEAMKKLDAGTNQTGDHVAVIINFSGPLPQPPTTQAVTEDDESPPSSADGPTLKNIIANSASEPPNAPVLNRDCSEPLISFAQSSAATSLSSSSPSPFLSSTAVHSTAVPFSSPSNLPLSSSPLLNSAAVHPPAVSSFALGTAVAPIQPAVTPQSVVAVPSNSTSLPGTPSFSSQAAMPSTAPDAAASVVSQAATVQYVAPQPFLNPMTSIPADPQPQYAYQPQAQPQPISQQAQSMYPAPSYPSQSLVYTQAPPTHSSQFMQQMPPNFNFASLTPEQQQSYLAQQQQQATQPGQSAPVKEEKKGRFLVREE